MPFQWGAGFRGINALAKKSPEALQHDWEAFCRAYLSICEDGGWQRDRVEASLNRLAAVSAPRRERTIEVWNCAEMSREDLPRHGGGPREAPEDRAWRLALQALSSQRRRASQAARAAASARQREEAAERAARRAVSAQRPAYRDLTFDQIRSGARARGEVDQAVH